MLFGRSKAAGARGSWAPEVVLITAGAPVLGSLVNPADPYLLHSQFPWLMLAPLAAALLHGLWAGLTSSVLLSGLAAWQALSWGSIPASFTTWSIGCGLTALIAGQIRDSLRGRAERGAERTGHLQDRWKRSERPRHLLQLPLANVEERVDSNRPSHAKLEERVPSSRSSLAGAIDRAERRIAEGQSMHELARVLLDVLATQGRLQAATLYLAAHDQGLLVSEPAASFGVPGASSARHPLVIRAFTTGKSAAFVDPVNAPGSDTAVVAAVPLITTRGRTVGVVAVHQLPFAVSHAQHLNQVFVLAGHLSDLLFDRWTAMQGESPWPREPSVMAQAVLQPTNGRPLLGTTTGTKEDQVATDDQSADGIDISIEIDADEVPVAETVNVAAIGALRAMPVDEAKRASDRVTTKLLRDRVTVSAVYSMRTDEVVVVSGTRVRESVEVPSASASRADAEAVSIAARGLESVVSSNVVGVFERGSAVPREEPRVERETAELALVAEPAKVAPEAIDAAAPTVNSPLQHELAATESRLTSTRETVARVVPAGTERADRIDSAAVPPVTVAPAAGMADVAPRTLAASRRSPLVRTSLGMQRINEGRVTTDEHVRTAEVTQSEAEATPISEQPRESRTILPPPVENARTAILAAFARKARSAESGSPVAVRPIMAASFRSNRTASAVRANTSRISSAAQPSQDAPVAAPAALDQAHRVPAKAEDARASVRAAFLKARPPAPAPDAAVRTPAASSSKHESVHAATRDRGTQRVHSEVVPTLESARLATTPALDDSRYPRPSVDEARAAMLATLAKARSIAPAARVSTKIDVAAAAVNRAPVERAHEHEALAAAKHQNEAAPERATAHAKPAGPERASRLPAPPAPAGLAAVRSITHGLPNRGLAHKL